MADLRLSLAIGDYAHTQDLTDGRIRPSGIELTVVRLPFEAVAFRFAKFLEFDVAEFSLGNYCARLAGPEPTPMVAIPVFTSRAFRHGAIYVNAASGIRGAADLAGRRVGIPQWSQTATIYVRGDLEHRAGVPLAAIDWVQAGVDDPGRTETAEPTLPPGVRLRSRPDRSLSALLLAGEIDALISARPPAPFRRGDPRIRRLFADDREEEERAFRETGIFPIMHVVALRRDVFERDRWIARNLFEAFEAAKRACLARMADVQVSYLPTAWGADALARVHGLLFGGDGWPYGLEPNRTTLDAFLRFCHEQGVTARRLSPDELFPPESLFETRI